MFCPYCQSRQSRVIETTHDSRGVIRRRRQCKNCSSRYSTQERAVLGIPLIVKQDGRREDFDREKVLRGVRIACAKRPVSEADIDRLIGEVEASLQRITKPEIDSQVVGDLVISRLKALDQVAYIRFAIVYLGLDDLQSIRAEIDRLRDNQPES